MIIWQQYKKIITFTAIFFSLLLFGDSLLHFFGHSLHIILEFVEAILEHFLEATFGLSARQAQIVLFYSFVAIMSYVLWRLSCKAYFVMLNFYAAVKLYWRTIKKRPWFKAAMMMGALGTTVYLFS
jgi:hypothetical protein